MGALPNDVGTYFAYLASKELEFYINNILKDS